MMVKIRNKSSHMKCILCDNFDCKNKKHILFANKKCSKNAYKIN